MDERHELEGDRAVLEALYDATGGADWTDGAGWKTSAPLGEWRGVTTDAAGRVTRLGLADNGLTGSIPPALGSLTSLAELDLDGNALAGPIPGALGALANLRRLSLRENALAGPIPGALGRLASLDELDLGGNGMTGPVPAGLGNLSRLRRLSLWGNDLTGPIPELGRRLARATMAMDAQVRVKPGRTNGARRPPARSRRSDMPPRGETERTTLAEGRPAHRT